MVDSAIGGMSLCEIWFMSSKHIFFLIISGHHLFKELYFLGLILAIVDNIFDLFPYCHKIGSFAEGSL